jgi:LmbE family N-acetylglucosaminyl deacetylase
MSEQLRLLGVFAHPDDETLGFGGSLAKYAAEGVETHVLCATRGERGRFGDAAESPGLEIVGKTREAELRCAAAMLNVHEVNFLDYIDADLDKAEAREIVPKIAAQIRRIRPQVVVSFAHDGGYGHPDHIAISQFTNAACVAAASSEGLGPDDFPAHQVSKLYYMSWTANQWDAYQAAFKRLVFTVDGVTRQALPWPDWSITTRVDATAHWETVWQAVQCHKTQISIYSKLAELSQEQHRTLWGVQEFYRAFSLVNSGRELEDDLFAGVRKVAE